MADAALLGRKRSSADPDLTAKASGAPAWRSTALRTLWLNTGSLCNITCRNCYINSSPENDGLAYIARAEAKSLSRRDRARPLAGAGDRLHRRRAVHESRHYRHARRCARSRLRGAGADQRDAADAASAVRDGLAALRELWRPAELARQPRSLFETARHRADRGLVGQDGRRHRLAGAPRLPAGARGRTCWGESEADARAGYAA